MSKADEIITKLENMTLFIEEARNTLMSGEVMNLSHLDGEVADLCEQTMQLPPQEAVRVQPIMARMIAKLEELGMALKDFQSNLKGKGN